MAGKEDIMSKTKHAKKKKDQINMDHNEIRKGYAEYYRNKREVLSGETYRSRRRTGPEKAPSQYRLRF